MDFNPHPGPLPRLGEGDCSCCIDAACARPLSRPVGERGILLRSAGAVRTSLSPAGRGSGRGGLGARRGGGAARRRAALRLSDDALEEFGYAPTDPPPDWEETRTWTNARTGETARVPVGIDPGFQHNAGTISRKAFATPALVAARIARAEDVTVWRGRQSVRTHRRGDEIVDRAFTSTSASWRTAARFADYTGGGGGAVYRIRAPRGTRAVVENEGEQEIVFAPLQKFRVVDVIDGARDGANVGYTGPDRIHIMEAIDDD